LVDFHGEQKAAVRVQIDPTAVAALGLSLEEVRGALASATVNAPKGILDGPKRSLTLETSDQLREADAFGAIVIAYHNGAPVRIRDTGFAAPFEPLSMSCWLISRVGGKPVMRDPGRVFGADQVPPLLARAGQSGTHTCAPASPLPWSDR
jgi:AcrB/AcrD/AcrF family